MAAGNQGLASDVTSFKHYLQAERGLAKNSLLAYGRDLERFQLWVADGGLANYLEPTVRELSGFLAYCRQEKLAAADGGPASGRAENVLPLPAAGRARSEEHRGAAQLADFVGTHPASAQPGIGKQAADGPARR